MTYLVIYIFRLTPRSPLQVWWSDVITDKANRNALEAWIVLQWKCLWSSTVWEKCSLKKTYISQIDMVYINTVSTKHLILCWRLFTIWDNLPHLTNSQIKRVVLIERLDGIWRILMLIPLQSVSFWYPWDREVWRFVSVYLRVFDRICRMLGYSSTGTGQQRLQPRTFIYQIFLWWMKWLSHSINL